MSLLRNTMAAAAAIVLVGLISPGANAQSVAPQTIQIRKVDSIDLSAAAYSPAANRSESTSATINQALQSTLIREGYVNRRIPVNGSIPRKTTEGGMVGGAPELGNAASSIPITASIPYAKTSAGNFAGFKGIDTLDSDTVNPTIPGIEPPDQGMCVGNGKVYDMANLVIAQYDTSGVLVSGPLDLNSFFAAGLDFISDPRCYYDSASNTFFFTITDLGGFPNSFTTSSLLIAVLSGSSGGLTPTEYVIPTTDDGTSGTPVHPNCPCFEDQPLLGADANGIYISGNEFPIDPSNPAFNGAQIYAIRKADLIAGSLSWVLIPNPIALAEGIAASVQPAISIPGQFATNTEYFLSSLDFNATHDNRIAVWAMTNTCAIPSTTVTPCAGSVSLLAPAVLNSMAYGVPPNATQKGGPHPLGQLVRHGIERLQTDDDRMQQVVLMNGGTTNATLYSALTTTLKVGGGVRAGILYFFVQPSVAGSTVSGTITSSGYVAHSGANLFYPSIGVTPGNSAAMVFSLSNGGKFPSVAYVPLSNDLGTMQIYFAQPGLDPYDGASGYVPQSNGTARWGDYSTAFTDGTKIWLAGEYATGPCNLRQYKRDPTCGDVRSPDANWGTFIGAITPP